MAGCARQCSSHWRQWEQSCCSGRPAGWPASRCPAPAAAPASRSSGSTIIGRGGALPQDCGRHMSLCLCLPRACRWIAGKLGLVRTMVFTHAPSNIFTALIPLMPTPTLALLMLFLRCAAAALGMHSALGFFFWSAGMQALAVLVPAALACTRTHTRAPALARAPVGTRTRTSTHAHTRAHAHAHTCTHSHVHTHVYTHTHAQPLLPPPNMPEH